MDRLKLIGVKIAQFLREVRTELRKVTWPSWKATVGSTSVVVVVVVIMSVYLGLVDLGLTSIIKLILG